LEFGVGGSQDQGWSGIVCCNHRYDSITEEDRARVREWLGKQVVVESISVSGPWDVWHGPDPFEALQPNQ
jgi:uncharacterized protein YggL (DUF469 family)